jgi:GT2 family glycosyltransferase/glycosyltransferase involved in cell wall biosynthesis
MAAAGHDVHLISEGLAAPRARLLAAGRGPHWTRLREKRSQHRYFTEQHEYADRVYDTLRTLTTDDAFDVIEFDSADAQALTTVRAKRLLGEFANTTLVVRTTESDQAAAHPLTTPVDFERYIDDFARGYVLDHADTLLIDTQSRPYDEPDADRSSPNRKSRTIVAPFLAAAVGVSSLRIPEIDAASTIWHLGALNPDSGLETFLTVAASMVSIDPQLKFVVAGDDTESDPFGRSYWAFCHRTMGVALREAVSFVGPLADARTMLPKPGNRCVIGAAAIDGPGCALLAMARGCLVVVREGTAAAAFVDPAVSALVVEPGRVEDLKAALDLLVAKPAHAAALVRSATTRLARHAQPAQVAAGLAGVYVSAGRHPASESSSAPSELVSVVIPLYNQGSYLLGAIESVRTSTYPHIEIVVVDDGSTDVETIGIFDALSDVTKVRQANAGLSAARNAGIAAAAGDYIVPLDSDDLLPAGFVAPAVKALLRNAELGYVAGYLRYFGLLDYTHVPAGYIPHLSLVVNTHARATALFRRSALDAVGGYDTALPAFEDWDLHIRLALAGYGSDIVPVEGHMYRRHSESMTFSSSNAIRLELLQHLIAKHVGGLDHEQLSTVLLLMAQLWKTGYEPSASVALQRDRKTIVLPASAEAQAPTQAHAQAGAELARET